MYFSGHFTLFLNSVKNPDTGKARSFVLASSAFENGESIPAEYTCDAKQISPPLTINDTPAGTKSFVLVMEDRDVPKNLKPDGVFLHWLVFDIPADTKDIGTAEIVGVQGQSGNGVAGYVGPCPPSQYNPPEHRYYFDLYALDTTLGLSEGATMETVRAAMQNRMIAHTTLMGRYLRQ
jgi:Raf kinase inhibitor-like YbhB/YbcL family protein